ncbi:MAG: SH3 domain-containing protein, partial [Desulfobacterales bacterium]|nr:SH3 domain-containing protein [Desulfobacterales bacterium]
LNLRKSPIINQTNIITKIPYGAGVKVISVDNSWSYVEYKEYKGYVASKYLVNQVAQKSVISKETTVLICNSKSSYSYHRYKCRGLSRCKAEINRLTLSNAKSSGYRACKICY